jgi:catechol 2,3-dioxygenase-like lactoylglutathione lyase family enzyme
MFKRIDHIELLTAAPERTIAFYTGVLGFRERERSRIPETPAGRSISSTWSLEAPRSR